MSLDQGTTSSRCTLFDRGGNICASVQKEFRQIYPQDTLYHLVKVGIHSVDLPPAALLLGLLLPQLLEQGQVLVKKSLVCSSA